jgi:prephenate dehydrogenase
LQWSIGLVGYGEVGRILAEDLRARGVERVLAYDIKFGSRPTRRCWPMRRSTVCGR